MAGKDTNTNPSGPTYTGGMQCFLLLRYVVGFGDGGGGAAAVVIVVFVVGGSDGGGGGSGSGSGSGSGGGSDGFCYDGPCSSVQRLLFLLLDRFGSLQAASWCTQGCQRSAQITGIMYESGL